MIKPGTTPTNTFTLPFTPQSGSKFTVVYAQGEKHKEKILFEKSGEACKIDDNKLKVRLEAENTRLIDSTPRWSRSSGKYAPLPIWMQIGIETPDGTTLWSHVIEASPGRVLKPDGVV